MLKLDPIWQPDAQQENFRLLLDAMARPGHRYTLDTLPENGTVALTVLATLLDAEVSLDDPHALLRHEDWPMLQAQSTSTEQADYILCDATQTADFTPKLGTLPSPELSATILLVVDNIGKGNLQLKLTGPGIKDDRSLSITGLDSTWLSKREEWNCAFPLGVDLILIDDKQVAALPRTTKVEVI